MPESSLNDDLRRNLVRYATRILTGRPYFRFKLKDKLYRRAEKLQFEDPGLIIEAILTDLEKAGFLDDSYLACSYVRRQLSKGYGPKIISLKLKFLGLDRETVSLALSQEAGLEAETAAIRIYSRKYSHLEPRNLTSRLYRRGFTSTAIRNLFDSEVEED